MKENIEKLKGRRAIWLTDSIAARATVAKQRTQNLSQEAWTATKKVLDLLQKKNIALTSLHVPGRLNDGVDGISQSTGQKDRWEKALAIITEEWGSPQEDPCRFMGEQTGNLETLEWCPKRALLVPQIDQICVAVELLESIAAKTPNLFPSIWREMCVLTTSPWKGTSWWPSV